MFGMKQCYEKPAMEQVEMDAAATMMTGSIDSGTVDTGVGNTPSRPDVRAHRGGWGDLWGSEE